MIWSDYLSIFLINLISYQIGSLCIDAILFDYDL